MQRASFRPDVSEVDAARADWYALLSHLFLAPPSPSLLDALAQSHDAELPLDSGVLAVAMNTLSAAALACDARAAREEFDALFVGTGTPLLNPYGSLYLCGFMMDFPLVTLREDLSGLGLARRTGTSESEDHLGLLCETMRVLIIGAPPFPPQPLSLQMAFFERHIAPWTKRCLADIRNAGPANFYRVVADVADLFFDVEAEAFAFEDTVLARDDAVSLT
ncbi:TorD/DmsD family molecular chaperone [Noviherbaspirillum galbum]|uniref:Molecular chaperone TorD n=1 Tax=Noviherbaspirillum galbum TaxID=2709383 RepID=A0A6B3SKV5_9BURK|nr:molecular chaperone TorD family protein [Noviherbaspirillum galbum]NEX59985.1 hypothetical protein [Noviherbaspirillum galbum]